MTETATEPTLAAKRARPVLVITRGIPASGKTTWAKQWAAGGPDRVRVNRDDLRHLLYDRYVLPYQEEKVVTEVQNRMVERLLKSGKSVVVDDTNLKLRYAHNWRDIAHAVGADFEVKDFTGVPLDTALGWDDLRASTGQRFVGATVVRDFYDRYVRGGVAPIQPVPEKIAVEPVQYIPDKTLPKAWLFDIDGTLAHMNDRGPFEWGKVGEDDLDETIASIAHALTRDHYFVVIVSGRDAACRDETMNWLSQHAIDFDALLMRAENDNRKDSIVKSEIFWRDIAPKYYVQGVFDDRNQVVEMWRSMGLTCLQVAEGDF